MDLLTLGIAKNYVADTADGLGAIKGAPCTVKNVEQTATGHKITLEWTGNSGATETTTLEVTNGVDGKDGKDGTAGGGGGYTSKWKGKTLVAFGTSMTYRCSSDGGYLKVLQDTLGLKSYTNNGLDGNAIAYVSGRTGISRKIQSTDITGYDIVLIEGCTNDFKLNVKVGEVGNMGDTSFDDSADFCQALRKAIESVYASNPEANIILVADPQRDNADYDVNYTNSAGHKLIDYVNAMLQVGALYSIPVCDLYRNSGINQYTLSAYTSDGLHPNTLGYKRIGNVIASSLENMYSNTVIIQNGNVPEVPDEPEVPTDITKVTVDGVEFDISDASEYAYKMIMKLSNNYYLYASNNPFYVHDKTDYAETFYAQDTMRSAQATGSKTTFSGFTSIASHGEALDNGYKHMTNTRALSAYKWTNADILYYGTDEVAFAKS